ncbi:MAG TPA: COX15/CtaA family protein [Gaiellaceae bacterium]|nr:COX15/CtaA family protein [Gaiellaceae bacterium]
MSSPELSVASGRVARLRAIVVTPRVFLWLAAASALSLYLILITGATVRLTASGLGCEHWPGCQAGQPFPEKGYHSYIEFGNRLAGAVTIALTLIAALGALRVRGLTRGLRRLAVAVFVGALAQAPLGYFTVRFHLNPYLVISHFLLSAVVLAVAVVVLLRALELRFGGTEPLVPLELRRVMTLAAAAALVLLVSGTVATASGPHPGDSKKIERLWRLGDAVTVHAGATAVFGVCFVFAIGYLAARRSRSPRLFVVTLAVLALLLVQMAIGETQYRTHLPWWLVLIHVGFAGAVWTGIVALATLFRRPLAWLKPAA